jgi:hypothetical protein
MANKKNSKANKKSKIFGGSKRRPTAYNLFSSEKRQQLKVSRFFLILFLLNLKFILE